MTDIVRIYKYEMGFKVNGTPIPDPAVYTGKASALDSKGARSANGMLYRCMVATKRPVKLEYHGISYDMMERIMSLMTGESFQFTMPTPDTGMITIKAYVGDRDWDTTMAHQTTEQYSDGWKKNWYGNLSFSVIEF